MIGDSWCCICERDRPPRDLLSVPAPNADCARTVCHSCAQAVAETLEENE